MRSTAFLAAALLATASSGGAASIDVLGPRDPLEIGDEFTVDLVADVDVPVVGWGLDVRFDSTILSLEGVSIAPLWTGATSRDGDRLAALAFPRAIGGSRVPLATLRFRALTEGATEIAASATAGDLTEGFPLATPLMPGSFALVQSAPATVSVSEPAVDEPEPPDQPSSGDPPAVDPVRNDPPRVDTPNENPQAVRGGGGATGLVSLLALLAVATRRRTTRSRRPHLASQISRLRSRILR